MGAKQAEQHAMAAQLPQFQNQLNEQQRALDLKGKEQEEKTRIHDKQLFHVSQALGDTSRTIAELRGQVESDARRQSGRWSAFMNFMAEQVSSATNDAVASATAAATAATSAARVAANSPTPFNKMLRGERWREFSKCRRHQPMRVPQEKTKECLWMLKWLKLDA